MKLRINTNGKKATYQIELVDDGRPDLSGVRSWRVEDSAGEIPVLIIELHAFAHDITVGTDAA